MNPRSAVGAIDQSCRLRGSRVLSDRRGEVFLVIDLRDGGKCRRREWFQPWYKAVRQLQRGGIGCTFAVGSPSSVMRKKQRDTTVRSYLCNLICRTKPDRDESI